MMANIGRAQIQIDVAANKASQNKLEQDLKNKGAQAGNEFSQQFNSHINLNATVKGGSQGGSAGGGGGSGGGGGFLSSALGAMAGTRLGISVSKGIIIPLKEVWTAIKSFASTIKTVAKEVSLSFRALESVLKQLPAVIVKMAPVLTKAAKIFALSVSLLFSIIEYTLIKIAGRLGKPISALVSYLTLIASSLATGLKGLAINLTRAFTTLVSLTVIAVRNASKGIVNGVRTILARLPYVIASIAMNTFTKLSQTLQTLIVALLTTFGSLKIIFKGVKKILSPVFQRVGVLIATSFRGLGKVLSSFGSLIGRTANAVWKTLNTAFQLVEKALKGLGKGILAAAGIAAGAMALAYKPSSKAGKEETQSNVNKVLGGWTDEQAEAVDKQVKAVAKRSIFNMEQMQSIATGLRTAGLSPDQIVKLIPTVNDFAVGAQMDPGEATTGVAGLLGSLGKTADEMETVMNYLGATAGNSNTSVQDMMMGLVTAAPAATVKGIDYKTLFSEMGALADVGIQGEVAGTMLRGAYQRWDTDEAAQIRKETGADYGMLQREGGVKTIAFVAEAYEKMGLSLEEINSRMEKWLGNRVSNIRAVTGESVDKKLEVVAGAVQGYNRKASNAAMSGVGGAYESIKSQFDVFLSELGDILNKAFGPFLESFANNKLEDIFYLIEKGVANIVDYLKNHKSTFSKIADVIVGIGSFILKIPEIVLRAAITAGMMLHDTIASIVPGMDEIIPDGGIDDYWNKSSEAMGEFFGMLKDWGKVLFDAVAKENKGAAGNFIYDTLGEKHTDAYLEIAHSIPGMLKEHQAQKEEAEMFAGEFGEGWANVNSDSLKKASQDAQSLSNQAAEMLANVNKEIAYWKGLADKGLLSEDDKKILESLYRQQAGMEVIQKQADERKAQIDAELEKRDKDAKEASAKQAEEQQRQQANDQEIADWLEAEDKKAELKEEATTLDTVDELQSAMEEGDVKGVSQALQDLAQLDPNTFTKMQQQMNEAVKRSESAYGTMSSYEVGNLGVSTQMDPVKIAKQQYDIVKKIHTELQEEFKNKQKDNSIQYN